jgi:8-hydroxy-5-deazaflavin:NADPH oxidoreductase
MRLGIVGAGKLGTTIARAAIAAGYDVTVSGSGPADDIALTLDVLAPGARAATTADVVRHADIIVLAVQEHFPLARVVKSLNQLGYHELEEHRRPKGAPDRIAIGAAGDDRLAVRAVMRLIERLGFDAVDAGPLEHGVVLEPDGSPFAITYDRYELLERVSRQQECPA